MPPDPEAAEPHPWRCAVTGVAAETAPRPASPPRSQRGARARPRPRSSPSSRPTWPASPSTSGATWGVAGLHQGEFGEGVARPSEGHIQAVNQLLATLRRPPRRPWRTWSAPRAPPVATEAVGHDPAPGAQDPGARLGPGHREDLGLLLRAVRPAPEHLRGVAGRLRPHRARLLPARLHAPGIGAQHSAPPPFAYMRTGFSPATFRRGIPLRRLGRQLNPFPLVQLPYTASSTRGRWGHPPRGQPQPAERAATGTRGPIGDPAPAPRRRRPRRRRAGVGPLEPRDLRRHARR